MIEIVYNRTHHHVSVTGHAGSAEKGKDIPCATVSSHVYTLAQNVEELCRIGAAHSPDIEIMEGDASITCDHTHKHINTVTLVFDAVCLGFGVIAEKYPEFVRFEIHQ